MRDIAIPAPDGAASLERIGTILGAAGVDLLGGGMWEHTAHYLVADAEAATRALQDSGLDVVAVREVLLVPLDADVPGALGRLMRQLAAADVRLDVQYTDHHGRKVLVVDDRSRAAHAVGLTDGSAPT
ncbi:amino acid-binding ACT domain-containing protein [Aeromicrobium senzhongii]|uniref:Amino acid-binding ACT domain-containing protein n=1 Tax=Aeromicrobium senzhongii TaxID=2663859 RepID=A0ABX6SRM3_9ACTN|nr:amino acid-binding ACT domain-containing protein [Aeromicrobium senzhongii]MTB87101.1 amino acid-binding ACT domain-containing protein [Aeromicrobium senzhongii]QNL93084.1 amino acid-binding ACT domain-containing protein [Aeromicrobium senzhongii]